MKRNTYRRNRKTNPIFWWDYVYNNLTEIRVYRDSDSHVMAIIHIENENHEAAIVKAMSLVSKLSMGQQKIPKTPLTFKL